MDTNSIEPINGMLLVKKIPDEDLEKKEERTTASGIYLGSSKSENMKANQYVKFEVVKTPIDIERQIHLRSIVAGCVVGVEYNTQRGIGVDDYYLVPAPSVKFVIPKEIVGNEEDHH